MAKPQTKRQKVDWDAVQRDYVQGVTDSKGHRSYPGQREVAKLHGVHPATIAARAKASGWLAERERFQAQLAQRITEKKTEAIAITATEVDTEFLTGFRAVRMRVTQLLAAKDGTLKAADLNSLSQALRTAHQGARLILGEPTDDLSVRDGGGISGLLQQAQELQSAAGKGG